MSEIQEIVDLAGLESLEADWNAWLERTETRSVFMTFDWMVTWWRHFHDGRSLFILVQRDGGEVVCILPMMVASRVRNGVTLRFASFLASGTSDALEVNVAGDPAPRLAALAQHIRDRSAAWDRIVLSDLPSASPTTALFADALREAGVATDLSDQTECPYAALEGEWLDFYNGRISGKTRSNNRNKLRKLEKLGEVQIRWLTDLAADPDALESIFAMDERGEYHGASRTRPFDSEIGQSFFRELCRRFSERGWLFIGLLEISGKLVAYRLCFRYRGVHCDYFPGFDPEYFKLSPGRILMAEIARDCFESGQEEIDFLRGFEDWKRDWTDSFRWNATLTAENTSWRSKWARFAVAPKQALRELLGRKRASDEPG
jgi:CelD/BcsL family acetyltransferase involved in cellulose biosynthesis